MEPTVERDDDSKPQIFTLTRSNGIITFRDPTGTWAGRILQSYESLRWLVYPPKGMPEISKTFATAWGAASALAIRWRESDPDYDRAPMCGRCLCCELDWRDCESCGGDGVDGRDCGEDCCMCLEPEENVRCGSCEGKRGFYWCSCDDAGSHEKAA